MLIYPLDTLKTRQQSQDFVKTFADPVAKTHLPSRQLFKGLYQGIGIVVVATLPAAVCTYMHCEIFISQFGNTFLPPPMQILEILQDEPSLDLF